MRPIMLRLHAVLETSLCIIDLKRAVAFYRDVLGLRLINDALFPEDRGAAFQVGNRPSVLLIFRADVTQLPGVLPPHGTTGAGHAAFRVEPDELPLWRQRLQEHGVPIETEFAFGNNPPSIYFRDPDGNSLELAVATIWDLKSS